MDSPINRLSSHTLLEEQGVKPLSQEARNVRAPLASSRSMLDAVLGEMESMETVDANKLRMYKVALVIIAIISFAITAAVPITMLFGGGALWLPVVLSIVGYTLCALSGSALRRACARIESKYRTLSVFRQQLLNQNPSYHKARSAKYSYCASGEQKTGKQLLDKIRSGLQPSKEEGDSLCEHLDLAGDSYQRLQSEASLGVHLNFGEQAYKCLSSVNKAKQGLFQIGGESVSEKLDHIAAQELRGVDMRMIPQSDLTGIANSLMSLCGFGAQVGRDVEKSLRAFERLHANSSSITSANTQVSAATKLFLSQGQAVISHSTAMFKELQRLVLKVQQGYWLSSVRSWLNQLQASSILEPSRNLGAQAVAHLCEQGYDLCLHEGAQTEGNICIKQLIAYIQQQYQDLGSSEEQILGARLIANQLEDLENYLLDQCKRLRISSYESPDQIVESVSKDLASYLNNLGDIQGVRDQIRLAIRLGQCAKTNLENCIEGHPEKASAHLYRDLSKLSNLLAQDSWGASSSRSVAQIVQEKDGLLEEIAQVTSCLNQWGERYREFHSSQLNKLILSDFSKVYVDLETRIDAFHDTCFNSNELDAFINQTRDQLESAIQSHQNSFLTQQDVSIILEGYAGLVSELQQLEKSVIGLSKKVYAEASSPSDVIWLSLSRSAASIADMKTKKQAELQEIFKTRRQDLRDQNSSYSEHSLIANSCSNMAHLLCSLEDLDDALEYPDRLSVQSVHFAFQSLFSAMGQEQLHQMAALEEHLQLVLNRRLERTSQNETDLDSLSEEIDAAQAGETVEAAAASRSNYIQSRNKLFDQLLTTLKQSLRSFRISSSLVSAIISLAFMIVGLLAISTQALWLPIAFCTLLFASEVWSLGSQYFAKKKELDIQKAALAKHLTCGPSKMAHSDFSNESIQNFARLQDLLHLEGGELFLANETVHDFHHPLEKRRGKSLQELQLQFQKDSKKIGQKMSERFNQKTSIQQEGEEKNRGLETQTSSLLAPSPQERINIMQDRVLHHCLIYQTEMARWNQEQRYNQILKQKVALGKENVEQLRTDALLLSQQFHLVQQALTNLQNETQESSDSDQVQRDLEQVLNCMKALYHPNTSQDEKQAAKHIVNNLFNDASSVHSLAVFAGLEMEMCTEAGALDYNQHLANTSQSIKDKLHRSANVYLGLEAKETLLDLLRLPEYKPFIQFSCKKDELQRTLDLLEMLKGTDQEAEGLESLSVNALQSALDKVSKCVAWFQELSPLAYSLLQGEGGQEDSPTAMMGQLSELNRTLALNIAASRQKLSRRAVKYLEKWGKNQLHKPQYQAIYQAMFEYVQETDDQKKSREEPLIIAQLKALPPFVLRCLMNELQAHLSLLIQQHQQHLDYEAMLAASDQFIQMKQEVMESNLEALQEQQRQMREYLQELGEEERNLQS